VGYKNKEDRIAYRVSYRAKNKEKLAAKNAAYKAANKEKLARYATAYRVTYRASNKEKIAAADKAYYAANRDRLSAASANTALRRKYGISAAQKAAMVRWQRGVCPICGIDAPGKTGWHVDHDHTTGRVRGVLCGPCNRGLGQFRDNIALLHNAADYLEARV
jgi:hypothetical protein